MADLISEPGYDLACLGCGAGVRPIDRFCSQCGRRDPADRRFHAEAIACPVCGPQLVLLRLDNGAAVAGDPIGHAARLIKTGEIVAVKGTGGYQLACDATNGEAVARLRRLKRRDRKPFALMARDLDTIRRYCAVGAEEEQALTSVAAPIVLLQAGGPERLPQEVAPGLATIGFMLPLAGCRVICPFLSW